MAQEFLKDPAAVLDYKFDWAAWLLADADTIVSHTVTADTGLTVASSSITDSGTSVTAWLSGGTHNTDYSVVCQIVTATRTDERTIRIYVRNQ
jgi:hypothetical protein